MSDKLASKPKITVFSDYICPFCFIGKSSIDKLQKEFEVQVEWRNIEIHPETPLSGIPRTDIDARLYSRIWLNVKRLAEHVGIEMRTPTVISNSSMALIAAEYARQEGRFQVFHDAIFRAYWQENKDIGDISVLLEIAKTVDLDPSGLKDYFKEGKWAASIEKHRRSASAHDVSGVPTFVIGKETVVGAQPHESIREIFLKEFKPIKAEVPKSW